MFTDKETLALRQGLISFDCALPQDWLDQTTALVSDLLGESRGLIYDELRTGVVWCYDGSIFGRPVAIDPAGKRLLGVLERNNPFLAQAARS